MPQVTLQVEMKDRPFVERALLSTWAPHLVAEPAGADPVVVVPDGDPAEGAEKRCDLDVEDVGQVALELSPHQEYLKERLFGRHCPP